MDLLIKNGKVIDGLGNSIPYKPWINADVGIEKEKISEIGHLSSDKYDNVIDASNFALWSNR